MFLFVSPGHLPLRSKRIFHSKSINCSRPNRRQLVASAHRPAWPFVRALRTQLVYSTDGRLMRPNATTGNLAERTASHLKRCLDGVYLVTGASGRTGRRVVRDLLAQQKRVRAFARDRKRLADALKDVGVDMDEQEEKGRLDVFISDLFNIPPELFTDVVRIASCTGTNSRPTTRPTNSSSQDSTQRAPITIESKPENVEYVGVKNLVNSAIKQLSGVDEQNNITILEFADTSTVSAQWRTVNDVVMGGVSQSVVRAEGGLLLFSGDVSTENNGGFASARMLDLDKPMDLGGYDGLILRVKGDGNNYKMIVRCESQRDGLCHCFTFKTRKGEWTDIALPFKEFNSVRRAKTVDDAPRLNPNHIVAFQFVYSKFEYDGELNPTFSPGSFELSIESIGAYVEERNPGCPRIVHMGSAATTRTLRKDEFKVQIPIVQLSDKIGRILDWKLAGEDAIRVSGIPYCILRATGLNDETEAVGVDNLFFDQGDFLNGKVSRDDMAAVIVNAFSSPALTNVTTEICARTDEHEQKSLEEQLRDLKIDESEKRKFAPFPYIPTTTPVPQ